jgi:glycosyltransferase involved in cell wall biosynthesis
MEKKSVILIRSSSPDRDIRIPKEIRALWKEYDVTVIGWNRWKREIDLNSQLSECKYNLVLFNFKSPFGKTILAFLPIWWCFILSYLICHKWDIVHIINLDSLFPAIIASKLKKKKLIYELLDTYEDTINLNEHFRKSLICLDEFLMRFADAIIFADDEQMNEFNEIPNSEIITMYDSPPIEFLNYNLSRKINDRFTLFYAGVLQRDRQLNIDKIITAIQDIDNVQLLIAGYGDLVKDIMRLEAKFPDKLKFLGKLEYSDVIKYCFNSDLIFILRDPIVPVYKYICGSTLFNAMICGTPIIVNSGTSTSSKVVTDNCGIVIDASDIGALKRALVELRDKPELRRKLGINARNAYIHKYNWDIMEARLLLLYSKLIK